MDEPESLEPKMGYYTPAQVAKLKGISQAGVYSAMHSGRLRWEKVYGRRVIPVAAFDEWQPVVSAVQRGKMGGQPAHKKQEGQAA